MRSAPEQGQRGRLQEPRPATACLSPPLNASYGEQLQFVQLSVPAFAALEPVHFMPETLGVETVGTETVGIPYLSLSGLSTIVPTPCPPIYVPLASKLGLPFRSKAGGVCADAAGPVGEVYVGCAAYPVGGV